MCPYTHLRRVSDPETQQTFPKHYSRHNKKQAKKQTTNNNKQQDTNKQQTYHQDVSKPASHELISKVDLEVHVFWRVDDGIDELEAG